MLLAASKKLTEKDKGPSALAILIDQTKKKAEEDKKGEKSTIEEQKEPVESAGAKAIDKSKNKPSFILFNDNKGIYKSEEEGTTVNLSFYPLDKESSEF